MLDIKYGFIGRFASLQNGQNSEISKQFVFVMWWFHYFSLYKLYGYQQWTNPPDTIIIWIALRMVNLFLYITEALRYFFFSIQCDQPMDLLYILDRKIRDKTSYFIIAQTWNLIYRAHCAIFSRKFQWSLCQYYNLWLSTHDSHLSMHQRIK